MKTNSLAHYPTIANHLHTLRLSEKQVNAVIQAGCKCIYEMHRHTAEDLQWMLAGSMAEKAGRVPKEDWKALADTFHAMFVKVYRNRTALLRTRERTMRLGVLAAWRYNNAGGKHAGN